MVSLNQVEPEHCEVPVSWLALELESVVAG